MRGMPCPACARPLMTFGRFLCEVDVGTVLPCGACGTLLRQCRSGWALLGALVIAFGLAGYGISRVALHDPTGPGLMVLGLCLVAAPLAFLVMARFLSWKFVPWRRADPLARQSVVKA
jgi:hypothetical protein